MPSKKLNTKGTPAQDLQAAREELKQFRRDVAILKKKGLLSKKYDARSVKPTRYLKGALKEFGDVLSGKATPVKVSKEKQAYYKKQGYRVKSGRVVVPHAENEKIIGTKGNFARIIKGRGGKIQIMDLGLNRENILQWQDDLRNNRFKLKPNEQLKFQMFGYNSRLGFWDRPGHTAQEQMAEYLEHYDMIEGAHDGEIPPEKQSEYVQGVVIMKLTPDENGTYPRPEEHPEDYLYNAERREWAAKRRAERERKRIERMGVVRHEEYLADRAENSREQRAKMTPEQRARYNEQAKKRMANRRAKIKAMK
jgi:hypothetical protein